MTRQPSLTGPSYPVAGLLCITGIVLHMLLSDPLLNTLGMHYSGEEGRFYEKIHPGTYFIFLSFAAVLWARGNPLEMLLKLYREQKIFILLLALYILLFLYMALRSGPEGLAFILDTHITMPICAIVLCYTPLSYCRRLIAFFIIIAAINSSIGIAESIGRFRIFTFDPDWVVLKERYFRASALRGHPLNNTMFTAVALFVALALRYHVIIKIFLVALFITSLVAFGGRAGLVYCILGLLLLSVAALRHHIVIHKPSLLKFFLVCMAAMVVPCIFVTGLYILFSSHVGERIVATFHWEESAQSRQFTFLALHYMRPAEIVFGVSTERVIDIAYRIGSVVALPDIENPWLLMFMLCGLITFPFWLAATLAFVYRLMKGQPLALQLAVLAYYIPASTSNSFGRKDSSYLIMVSAVICAVRLLQKTER